MLSSMIVFVDGVGCWSGPLVCFTNMTIDNSVYYIASTTQVENPSVWHVSTDSITFLSLER